MGSSLGGRARGVEREAGSKRRVKKKASGVGLRGRGGVAVRFSRPVTTA
jgi:hypothetical protein